MHPCVTLKMADFAELSMEAVPLVTENYEKVYDPLKDKTKQGIQKVKDMGKSRHTQGGGYESETDEEIEYDAPPRRNYTEPTRRRSPRGDDRRRSRRDYDDVVEERYVYKGPNKDRAKSMGRDGWGGGRGDGRKGKSLTSPTGMYRMLTPCQEAAVITLTPNLPSPLDPVNGVNLLEKEHSLHLV